MRTIVKGKNLDVLESDRGYAEKKLHRLERLLDDRSDAIVELSVEHNRSADQQRIVEVTLLIDGQPLRGVARASTFRAATDTVVDKLERRAIEHKDRPRTRGRPEERQAILNTIAEGTAGGPDTEERPAIVKVKRFAIEPMFEEDAVARMEELGHSFFIFVNAESERVAVLYRRRDGAYGVIEPTIGGAYTPGKNGH